MAETEIRSIDVHLEYPPGEIIHVEKLRDVGSGMYPVYYRRDNGILKASTSVTELIFESGKFVPNPEFEPPERVQNIRQLFGGDVWWPDSWEYSENKDVYGRYVDYINSVLEAIG